MPVRALKKSNCCESESGGGENRFLCGAAAGRSCRSAFAKSGIRDDIEDGERRLLRARRRPDARRAAVLARAGSDQLFDSVQNLIANLVQRPAEPDPPGKVVVNVNRRMERGILNARIDRRTEVTTIAHALERFQDRKSVV